MNAEMTKFTALVMEAIDEVIDEMFLGDTPMKERIKHGFRVQLANKVKIKTGGTYAKKV